MGRVQAGEAAGKLTSAARHFSANPTPLGHFQSGEYLKQNVQIETVPLVHRYGDSKLESQIKSEKKFWLSLDLNLRPFVQQSKTDHLSHLSLYVWEICWLCLSHMAK